MCRQDVACALLRIRTWQSLIHAEQCVPPGPLVGAAAAQGARRQGSAQAPAGWADGFVWDALPGRGSWCSGHRLGVAPAGACVGPGRRVASRWDRRELRRRIGLS